MPDSLLAILKICFLALLWLFFLRVLHAVWSEMATPAAGATAPGSPGAPGGTPVRAPAPDSARLKVVEPAERKGNTFALDDEVTVGRASGCQVSLAEDSFVSQLHARVFRRDGRLWLEDLGSTNGTYLNAKRVTVPTALRRGDRVQVGRTVLEVTR